MMISNKVKVSAVIIDITCPLTRELVQENWPLTRHRSERFAEEASSVKRALKIKNGPIHQECSVLH